MGETLLPIVLLLAGLFTVGMTIALYIGGAVYDIRQIRRERQFQASPNARRYRQRPLITILVLTKNNEAQVEALLEALYKTAYKKIEIIIVDGASTDQTRRIVRQFMLEHPACAIRLVAKRSEAKGIKVLQRAYRTYGNGELVTVLSPYDRPTKSFFHKVAMHFNSDAVLEVLLPAKSVVTVFSIAGLLQAYQYVLRQQTDKLLDVMRLLAPQNGVTYRKESFSRKNTVKRSSQHVTHLAHDASLQVASHNSLITHVRETYVGWRRSFVRLQQRISGEAKLRVGFRLGLTGLALIVTLILPIAVGYLGYIAIELHQPALLLATGGLFTIVSITAIWDVHQVQVRQKLLYTLGIPLTYGAMLLLLVMRVGVIGVVLTGRRSATSSGSIQT